MKRKKKNPKATPSGWRGVTIGAAARKLESMAHAHVNPAMRLTLFRAAKLIRAHGEECDLLVSGMAIEQEDRLRLALDGFGTKLHNAIQDAREKMSDADVERADRNTAKILHRPAEG